MYICYLPQTTKQKFEGNTWLVSIKTSLPTSSQTHIIFLIDQIVREKQNKIYSVLREGEKSNTYKTKFSMKNILHSEFSVSLHLSGTCCYARPALVVLSPLEMVSYPTETSVNMLFSISEGCWTSGTTESSRICFPFFRPLLPFSLGFPSSVAALGLRLRFLILLTGGSGLGSVFPERIRICRSMTVSMISRATSIMPLPRPCVTLENKRVFRGSLKIFLISSR